MLTESIQNLENYLYHTMLYIHSISSKFYRNFCQQIVWVSFNWKSHQRTTFTQQPWQAIKTPSAFLRLVHTMTHLMTCTTRLSGIVCQLKKTLCQRNIIPNVALPFTHTRTSYVHSDWQPGSSPTLLFGMWHKIH